MSTINQQQQQESSLTDSGIRRVTTYIIDGIQTWSKSQRGIAGYEREYFDNFETQYKKMQYAMRRILKASSFTAQSVGKRNILKRGLRTSITSLINTIEQHTYVTNELKRAATCWKNELPKAGNSINGLSSAQLYKQLFADLKRLREKYGELLWNRELKTLSMVTEEIILHGVNFGRFRIQIMLGNLAFGKSGGDLYHIVAMTPFVLTGYSQVTHPHVSHHVLCEGEHKDKLRKLWLNGQILDAVLLVHQILRNYNAASPHQPIGRWMEKIVNDDFWANQRTALRHKLQQIALLELNMPPLQNCQNMQSVQILVPTITDVRVENGTAQITGVIEQSDQGGFIDDTPTTVTVQITNTPRRLTINGQIYTTETNGSGDCNIIWCDRCSEFYNNEHTCPNTEEPNNEQTRQETSQEATNVGT